MPDANIIDQLQAQVKDEQEAVELYTKLANEIDNKGFYRRALLIRTIADDEQRHKVILEETIQELKTMGGLEKALTPTVPVYWWVYFGVGDDKHRFDTADEAKKFVEGRTMNPLSKAKWVNPYGFELSYYKGRNYISFFEGDENGKPTERYTWGQFS